jgi:hypothetical protein
MKKGYVAVLRAFSEQIISDVTFANHIWLADERGVDVESTENSLSCQATWKESVHKSKSNFRLSFAFILSSYR